MNLIDNKCKKRLNITTWFQRRNQKPFYKLTLEDNDYIYRIRNNKQLKMPKM